MAACPLLVMMSRHCKGRSSFTSFGVAVWRSKPTMLPLRTSMNQTCEIIVIILLGPFRKHLRGLESLWHFPGKRNAWGSGRQNHRRSSGPPRGYCETCGATGFFLSKNKRLQKTKSLGHVTCMTRGRKIRAFWIEGTVQREKPWKLSCLMDKPIRFRQQCWVASEGMTLDHLWQGLFHGGYILSTF